MVAMGWKYNMYNLQAAVLLPQMERLDASHQRRNRLAARYREGLRELTHIVLPRSRPDTIHAWHILAAWIDGLERDAVVTGMQREQVGVTVHYYPPVHLTSYFRGLLGHEPGSFPAAERISRTTLSLPIYAGMPDSHVDETLERLKRVLSSCPRAET
jgi:UDP-4-amino-4-deoxy-L-arabinose-oxoglutarate aminotransferase